MQMQVSAVRRRTVIPSATNRLKRLVLAWMRVAMFAGTGAVQIYAAAPPAPTPPPTIDAEAVEIVEEQPIPTPIRTLPTLLPDPIPAPELPAPPAPNEAPPTSTQPTGTTPTAPEQAYIPPNSTLPPPGELAPQPPTPPAGSGDDGVEVNEVEDGTTATGIVSLEITPVPSGELGEGLDLTTGSVSDSPATPTAADGSSTTLANPAPTPVPAPNTAVVPPPTVSATFSTRTVPGQEGWRDYGFIPSITANPGQTVTVAWTFRVGGGGTNGTSKKSPTETDLKRIGFLMLKQPAGTSVMLRGEITTTGVQALPGGGTITYTLKTVYDKSGTTK
jgi:hypothetical protein